MNPWTLAWHIAVVAGVFALMCWVCMWVTNDYPWKPMRNGKRPWR